MDSVNQALLFYTMKMNDFPGDLTDISAEKEPLFALCSILGKARIDSPLKPTFESSTTASYTTIVRCTRLARTSWKDMYSVPLVGIIALFFGFFYSLSR